MLRRPPIIGAVMLPSSSELLVVLAAFGSTHSIAFAVAALLAAAGVGVLWPRRTKLPTAAIEPQVACPIPDGASSQLPSSQWLRLTDVIAAGASRADEAIRSHTAASNTIEALEHDIWMLRDDLARIDERPAMEPSRRHRETAPAAIGIAA